MENKNKNIDLVDEKQALSLFFSSLLSDTEEKPVTENEKEITPQISDLKADAGNTVFLPEMPIEINDDVIETVEQEKSNSTENQKSDIAEEKRIFDEPFQVMMFKTAGLTLAVPLVELSGVITWPENMTEMPGHKDSYLGIAQHLDKKIPIIDIAQIVFPQERIASLVDANTQERLQRIVFINDFRWGLACDAVDEVITIDSKQIKWRKAGSKRAWLAGTVVEHMCALLDTNELSKLLNSEHS